MTTQTNMQKSKASICAIPLCVNSSVIRAMAGASDLPGVCRTS
jgi:hypothetical protein